MVSARGTGWHWGNNSDGVWRKNCREQDGRQIGHLVRSRLLEEDADGNTITSRVLYYVGDHAPPIAHLTTHNFTDVISRPDILRRRERGNY